MKEVFDRSYTGHEHLLGVGLVHMNGRLYDPMVHRFLMPDNFVQDPYNTQNFNRYGYVLNNPLMFTDASGEFFVAALIGAAIGVITNGINNSINGRGFFKGAEKAALFGAIGGVTAFGIGQIATNIASSLGSAVFQSAAHFSTGGFLSIAQGGDFLSGALAGGISSGIGSFAGGLLKNAGQVWQAVGIVGAGSVSGGISSVIGGGNFWDGVRQGAISSGLNHAAHIIQQSLGTKKLISKMEKAIEAQREAMLRFFSDPDNPSPKSFDLIDFNVDEYVYKKGVFSYKSATQYGVKGSLSIDGREILFDGLFYARPNNYVTNIENLGTTAGYGFLVKNALYFRGSGVVMRIQVPDNQQYQFLIDYMKLYL